MSAENEGRKPERRPLNPWRSRSDSLDYYADALHPPMPDRNNPLLNKKKAYSEKDKPLDFNQETRPAVRTYERYARYLGETIESQSFEDAPLAPPFDGYYATGLDPWPQRKIRVPEIRNDFNLNEEEEELELEDTDSIDHHENESNLRADMNISDEDWDNLPSRERRGKDKEVQAVGDTQALPHDLFTKAYKLSLKQAKNESQNTVDKEENITLSPKPWG